MRSVTTQLIALNALWCAACAGGGSDAQSPPLQQLPANIPRSQTYDTLAASYSAQAIGNPDSNVRDLGNATTVAVNVDGTSFTLVANENLDNGATVSANRTVPLPQQGSSSSSSSSLGGPTPAVTLTYPAANANLSYLAFGEWNSSAGGLGSINNGGFIAFGATTPGAGIPVAGTATYNGSFLGRVFGANDRNGAAVSGTVLANADFNARSLAFSSNTTSNPTGLALNLSGTLTYPAATNALTGAVATANGWSGSAFARFFGPAAQELGGSFRVESNAGAGPEVYLGSFGAKQ